MSYWAIKDRVLNFELDIQDVPKYRCGKLLSTEDRVKLLYKKAIGDHMVNSGEYEMYASTSKPLSTIDGEGSGLIPSQYNQPELDTAERMSGRKDDVDKLRMDLLPPEFLTATATILTFGAQKYSDRNWEKGMSWGRVFGALMRHMWAWWGGKGSTSTNFAFGEIDDETGFSHLWHASCCIAFLVAYEQRKIGTDDRHTS